MADILEKISGIDLIKKGEHSPDILDLDKRDVKSEDESMIKRGFYNGEILGCVDYKIENGGVVANCQKFMFFDCVLNRIIKKNKPSLVNVNAIIEVLDDKGEEFVILMKRDNKVYAYKGYWDFPAGLVHFNEDLFERLLDRTRADTGLDKEMLNFEKSPSLLYIKDYFFGLYYKVISKVSKERLEKVLSERIKKGELIFVKKSQMKEFAAKNKIYPKFLIDAS